MLRYALLLVLVLPMAACQMAIPVAATQVALPLATSRTVLSGTKQLVEIRTEPAGAMVSIPGYETRTSPVFIMLARGHSHTVRIAKDGYKTVTANLMSQRSDATLNASNVLGSALDEASGAAWELCPNRLTVTLESDKADAPASSVATAGGPRGAGATPPIVQRPTTPAPPTIPPTPTPPAANPTDTQAVLAEQIARLDRLLEQGTITQREHDVLVAAAVSASAVAGVDPSR
jgi:hypothetical protein